ncbi:MAG: Gfo/Idh/MocA family oxidoreductase [Mucilaginibacter sp.]|uniref:Gfo/Idh/MocA family protein n=1 Tax=Mucilaginibacter sp. TaxID=1882438 RepID=UPI002639EC25|nr:Gfo/Idh/MocA family oxidoreductase [Mucilaginibacter sp.]MDB5001996.1 Gfo/Idh/MocA family oxidoreductase [Mucilaginibacter sp.]
MKKNEEKASAPSRRDFVKTSALAAAGFTIVPRFVLGKGYRAPSDTLYYASIGLGGKGQSDNAAFVASGKAKPAFLCDVDQDYAAKMFDRYPDAKKYVDWREMFDKEHKNFDAVHCATPDHTHAVVATAAMSLKKHVYVQKPMAHDVYEARMMANMGHKYKVQTQMGNQGSSSDGVRQMMEWYDAGLIGDVTEVYCWTNRPVWPQGSYGANTPNGLKWPKETTTPPSTLNWDLWQGTAKERPFPIGTDQPGGVKVLPFNWRGWWDYGTGVLGDMGAHILHGPMKVLGLKYVSKVQTSVGGGGSIETGPASSYTTMTFPKTDKTSGPVKVHWMDGGIIPPRPEELDPSEHWGEGDGGMLFIGTKGKMTAGCYAARARLLPVSKMDDLNVAQKFARVKNSTEGHYAQWVEACLAGYGNMQTSSPFEEAALLTEAMLMCNLAIRGVNVPKLADVGAVPVEGRRRGGGNQYPARYIDLIYDAANLKVTNVDEVNQFVKRDYRAPFKLSGI